MADRNHTTVTEFVLIGFTSRPDLQIPLFMAFLLVYIVTLLGNLGMIVLIRIDSQLHTPMYFFLSHLAFVDLCYSSTITPKMLSNFLSERKTISYHACAAQLCCFLTFMITECFLLAGMAYDRCVAICNPLRYRAIMSQQVCIQLVAGLYLYSFCVALFHTIITFCLNFCASNLINHFYCDDLPLLALSCSNTYTKEMLIFAFASFDMISSLLIVLVSYLYIFSTILKIPSTQGRQKAFGTCASHLTAVTIFYGTLIFMYLQPSSNHSLDRGKVASLFYTVVIPMLNPLIYSLRNREVKAALRKVVYKILVF
ncbi:olfactory receptor 8U3-like [Dromaius novaehollandiae]|uniref:olfactory receptor 8U3-like n=1 Tax=Dromaius novaehollandiae TaxID=8790 RepID=UPI003120258B